jgi:hypothetical protein
MADRSTAPPLLGAQFPNPDKSRESVVPLWDPGQDSEEFVLLQPYIWGFQTHYLDGRVHPCTLAMGRCNPCLCGWTPRFRGFAGAMRYKTHGRYVVQVTKHAWEHSPDLARLNGKLEGRSVLIRRATAQKQAKVFWEVIALAPRTAKVAPINVIDVLTRLWGIDLVNLMKQPNFDGDCSRLLQPYLNRNERKQAWFNKKGGAT